MELGISSQVSQFLSPPGADFVEFDVQLSKDHTVVIFHDFHVLVSVATRSQMLLSPQNCSLHKSSSKAEVIEMESPTSRRHQAAVRDLTLEQLRLLHVN
jgi:glycerophosphoryl diester phosphodiesterase